jgi:hypothetical protein
VRVEGFGGGFVGVGFITPFSGSSILEFELLLLGRPIKAARHAILIVLVVLLDEERGKIL